MEFVVSVMIFCIILFLYLHIFFHLKTSDDLEIFEIEQPSKERLEEVCDLRQPVLFDYDNTYILENCKRDLILDTYGAFDVKIRNKENEEDNELYVLLNFCNAMKVLQEDDQCKYMIENNEDFLEETGLIKSFRYNDSFIRPHLMSRAYYDIWMGSDGTQTPFRYDLNYRNFYLVTEGKMRIKLAPPKNTKYLYEIKDYDNFEFRTPVNPWNIQQEYKPDFDKVKCLELTVKQGQILYIPAYWWYSVEYSEDTLVCVFKYNTYMNNLAMTPDIIKFILQRQNVERKMVPTVDLDNGLSLSKKKIAKEDELLAGTSVAGTSVAGSSVAGSSVAGSSVAGSSAAGTTNINELN